MGFCAEPTPDMDGFRVEVRRESFYLTAVGAGKIYPKDLRYVEFNLKDIPALRSALNQAERIDEHGSKYAWVKEDSSGSLIPVEVVFKGETVDLSSLDPMHWIQLLNVDGQLRGKSDVREYVSKAVSSPEAVSGALAAQLAKDLSAPEFADGPAAALRTLINEKLAELEEEYQQKIKEAFAN